MDLRDALRKISSELGKNGQVYDNKDVILGLRRDYSELIAANSRKLEDIALKRLLADIDAKRVRNFDPAQGDLFSDLAGMPTSYNAKKLGLSNKGNARVQTLGLGLKHLRLLAETTEAPAKIPKSKQIILKLIEQYEKLALSEDEPIAEIIKRSRED